MTTDQGHIGRRVAVFTAIALVCLGLASCTGIQTVPAAVPVEDRAGIPAVPPVVGTAAPPVPAPGMEPLPPAQASAPTPMPAPGATPVRPAAVVALVQRQEAASRGGDSAQAAAELERALRISPNDRELWLRLARVRLQQGQWPQAESMAMKCLSLSGGDPETARSAWDVVASARAARGDAVGAAKARQQAAILAGS